MKVTRNQAIIIGNKLRVNFDVVDEKMFQYGMNVEMEHGKGNKITNVINNNLLLCGRIVLAHLFEYPDYYYELDKMEEKLKKRWKGKVKPNIITGAKKL